MRLAALFILGLGLFSLAASACSDSGAPDGAVHVIVADGTVGPIMERFLDRAISRAEDHNARLAVIELDTPGGLSTSMRDIVQRIERATVPVAVYVYPVGSRAASAGTFITMAGHIASMAPNTSIGAASAINSNGSDIGGTLGKKVENDAVAFIRGIAELRGRNADWAEQAVRDAVAVNQTKAVELHVVDFVATDLDDLLKQSEGRQVELKPGQTIRIQSLAGAPRVTTEMTAWEHFLDFIADPTVASLLLSLGFIAILIEMANPGLILPGTAGLIAIALGFLGFDVLPVDTVGIVLILLGLGMIALELFVPSGILGTSGVVAIILGAIVAFRDTPAELRPPAWLLAVIIVIAVLMFAAMALTVNRVRKLVASAGPAALIGRPAVARTELGPSGWVFIQGERWKATLEGEGEVTPGETVRVVGADGLRLRVRKETTHDHPGDE